MNEAIRRSIAEGGVTVLVGSAGPDGTPACCRGVAVLADERLEHVTIYVPMATSREVLAHVAVTKRIAVTASYPLDHSSVQFKGTVLGVGLAAGAEEALVRERFERLGEVMLQIGTPRRLTRSINTWPAFVIEVKIEELFEQTPGPNAGVALR